MGSAYVVITLANLEIAVEPRDIIVRPSATTFDTFLCSRQDLFKNVTSPRSSAAVRMPYTPPSSHTPTGSQPQSPDLGRSQSYNKDQQQTAYAAHNAGIPNPPRSVSSSRDYLQKHRRTPSISESPAHAPQPATPDATPLETVSPESEDGSYRPSESDLRPASPAVARGTVISPPDSSQNSSDDEANDGRGRRRKLDNIAELQAAIRITEQHRESSPNRASTEETRKARMTLGLPEPRVKTNAAGTPFSARPPLSAEARKISHSRSSTDASAFQSFPRHKFDSPSRSVSENDFEEVDEADLPEKPPLVRKKSGEPVRPALRPSSAKRRPSSMPGTPTYSKAVHFNNDLEQVRTFLQVDRPLAVSVGSSPVENYESELEFPFSDRGLSSQEPPFEWEMRLTNFPGESLDKNAAVKVERVYLSLDNKNLLGAVAVRNMSFHKLVVARFTLDYWKTTSEVKADFNNDIRRKQVADGYDRFVFSIKLEDLANLESKTMSFCVRYSVAGQEFWDNNNSINYQVDFTKKAKAQDGKPLQGTSARALSALPRSKPTGPSNRPRSFPSTASDDFTSSLASPYEFSSFPQPSAQIIGDSPIRFKKPAPELVPDAPGRRTNAAGQAFSNRYDFGASLSAAIEAASNALGDRSEAQIRNELKSAPANQLSFTSKPTFESAKAAADSHKKGIAAHVSSQTVQEANKKTSPDMDTVKPIALTTAKPSVQSSSYHELLDKYCFVRSRPDREAKEPAR